MKFRHLFLDSRYRTSGSDSDFSINLSETVETEEGARCYVGGVSFANVFYTIEEGLSDIWYVEVSGTSLGMGPGAYGLKLAYGNYGGDGAGSRDADTTAHRRRRCPGQLHFEDGQDTDQHVGGKDQ